MNVPILPLQSVYHLGTLDPAGRGRQFRYSMEGDGLSVSLCPDGWRQIAKLGGSPLWRLDKPGGRFLDIRAALYDERFSEARHEIERWATAEGFVNRQAMYRGWFHDDEMDEWMHGLYASHEEAAEELRLDGDDHDGLIESVEIIAPTRALIDRLGLAPDILVDGLDYAAMAWASDVLIDASIGPIDGVWWTEAYAPDRWSAPRGAIFPNQVSGWSAVKPLDCPDDHQLLADMPGVQAVRVDSFGASPPDRLLFEQPQPNGGGISLW